MEVGAGGGGGTNNVGWCPQAGASNGDCYGWVVDCVLCCARLVQMLGLTQCQMCQLSCVCRAALGLGCGAVHNARTTHPVCGQQQEPHAVPVLSAGTTD
jgi:hypothetical protein